MKAFRTAFWVWAVVMVFLVAAELLPNHAAMLHFSGLVFCVVWFYAWMTDDHDRHSNEPTE